MTGLSDEMQLAELKKRYRLVDREIRGFPIHKVLSDLKNHGFLIQRINYAVPIVQTTFLESELAIGTDLNTTGECKRTFKQCSASSEDVIENISICIFAPTSPLGDFERILPLLERRFETWYVGNRRENARRIFFHYGSSRERFQEAPLTNSVDRDGSMITIRECTSITDAYRIVQHLCSLLGWSWVAMLGYCRPPTCVFHAYWTYYVIQNPLLLKKVSKWLTTTSEGAKTMCVIRLYAQIPDISISRVVEVSSFLDGIHNLGAFFQGGKIVHDSQLAHLQNEIDYLVLLARSLIPYIVSELQVLPLLQAMFDDVESEEYTGGEIPNPTCSWTMMQKVEEENPSPQNSPRAVHRKGCDKQMFSQITSIHPFSHIMQSHQAVIELTDDETLLTDSELLAQF
jgi:hypothetical protein